MDKRPIHNVIRADDAKRTFDFTEVEKKLKPAKIIHFEDDQQDFLRWYVAGNGVVVCSEPFQTNIWAGYVIIRAVVGQEPLVRTPEGSTRKVRHRVARIEQLN
jgi:hypothetical protein